eukprot:354311-Chlamydomonas_euryale.AAC.2
MEYPTTIEPAIATAWIGLLSQKQSLSDAQDMPAVLCTKALLTQQPEAEGKRGRLAELDSRVRKPIMELLPARLDTTAAHGLLLIAALVLLQDEYATFTARRKAWEAANSAGENTLTMKEEMEKWGKSMRQALAQVRCVAVRRPGAPVKVPACNIWAVGSNLAAVG